MNAIAEHARVQVEWLNSSLEDEEAIDPIPQGVLDPRNPPADRIVELVEYLRGQVDDDTTIVWLFLPEKLGDVDGFRDMTRPLVPTQGVPRWSAGHRFIVREQLNGEIWAERLHQDEVEDALVHRFEMSPQRVADDLVSTAANPNNTDDQRMAALSQLAGLDLGHKRYPEALDKYDALEGYYGATKNPNMQPEGTRIAVHRHWLSGGLLVVVRAAFDPWRLHRIAHSPTPFTGAGVSSP